MTVDEAIKKLKSMAKVRYMAGLKDDATALVMAVMALEAQREI